MNLKISFLFALNLWIIATIFGQIEAYHYKRGINGINHQWHQIILPETIYEKLNTNFSDIRIYGIIPNRDTIEVPYLLKIAASKTEVESINFKLINTTNNSKGYYFTFELPANKTINQLKLDFAQKNFNWITQLEGSQNLQNWFTITDDYRIVSIKNKSTDYQFSNINFPATKFPYYRLFVKTSQIVTLKKAALDNQKTTAANYQSYPIISKKIDINKKQKITVVALELVRPVPVSYLKIKVADAFDFYRPISIQYLKDSIKTELGWQYHYRNLNRNIISSLEPNEFTFESTIAKKLKIIIQNQDNPPLAIDSLVIQGYQHRLVAHFTQPAEYFLTYGNKNAPHPDYDIGQFEHKIPSDLNIVTVAAEQEIPKIIIPKAKPIFENKLWLWGLMVAIIGILGWFTLKMLKEKS